MHKLIFILAFIYNLFLLTACQEDKYVTEEKTPHSVEVNIEGHPRILLNKGEESKINNLIQKYPGMKAAHQYIIDYADKILNKPSLTRVLVGKRMLAVSSEALTRIYFLSYSYRMTGDKKYAQRAEIELLAVCSFQDWNPTHFLDIAEMTSGVAIGYDWLYDFLSESTRKIIRKSIIDKAFRPAADPKKAWFYTAVNNWNQVCNAGMVLGALAIYEDEPEMAQDIIDKSVKSTPLVMDSYAPEGAYPEGFSYWGYGTGFEVTMLASLQTALGTDYNLSADKNFMRSPYFILYMTTPTGQSYNYGDSGKGVTFQTAMYWFAEKLKDSSLLLYEYQYLSNLNKYIGSDNDKLLPNILVFSKNMDLSNMEGGIKENFWVSSGLKPLFIYRSGWTDKNNSYLGIVGGAANVSHGHMDAGSFLYEKNGVRWSMELGLQSYETLENKGVDLWNLSQDGQRWDVFRLGNTGHSTLIINNERSLVDGAPQIIDTYKTESLKGAKLDLSPLFIGRVIKAIRTVTLNSDNDLTVSDRIITNNSQADITWLMVTPANSTKISSNQIELNAEGHKMVMTVDSPINVELFILDNKPVHDYDQDNPGTCRVGYKALLSGTLECEIKVSLTTID